MAVSILSIVGTRPEAIKMAPVIQALKADPRFEAQVLVTAQHREMLDQVLDFFSISADYDLDLMEHGQTLERITERVLQGTTSVFNEAKPDVVLVHGDTTTTFAAALAAFYAGISIGHVEAGMRTGDIRQPFPEELNRSLVARLATWHFAPSKETRDNLLRENIDPSAIIQTSHNTGVDALLLARKILGGEATDDCKGEESKNILVTAHRRESWGEPMREIFSAIAELAELYPDFTFNVATHANPLVAGDAAAILGDVQNVNLLGHQTYGDFVRLMSGSRLILSDSGGIQEEGPTLGVPVVVLRNKTEYHELLDEGVILLAGTGREDIVGTVQQALNDAALTHTLRVFASERAKQSSIPKIIETLATS